MRNYILAAFEVWRDWMGDPTLTIDDYMDFLTSTSWKDFNDNVLNP
jgi:hypothetical protein